MLLILFLVPVSLSYPLVLMATSKRNDPYGRFNFLLDHRRKIMMTTIGAASLPGRKTLPFASRTAGPSASVNCATMRNYGSSGTAGYTIGATTAPTRSTSNYTR